MDNKPEILIVDDEESIRLFLESVLESEGYPVRTAEDGSAGLEEVKRKSPDILLTDLMMPNLSGLELMKAAKEIDPSLEAILMTAHSTVESAVGALRHGAYDFLTKPIEDIDLLLNVIQRTSEKIQLRGKTESLYKELEIKHTELTEKAKELEATLKGLTSLIESSSGLSTVTNMDGLLAFYINLLGAKLGVFHASISVIDKANGHLDIRKVSSDEGGHACTMQIPSDGSLTSQVLREGRPVIHQVDSNDSSMLEAFRADTFLPRRSSSIMIIPISNNGRLLGVIHLCNQEGSEGFSNRDLNLAQAISHQIGAAIENIKLRDNLEKGYLDTITTLVNSLEAKDSITAGHSERVTHICVVIAKFLGMDEEKIKDLRLAGILHDIGKIGIEERILQKKAKLTPEEFEVIKLHPLIGYSILKPLEFLGDIRLWILEHHENYSGGGYPTGKPGKEMMFESRIITVADAYDAITSDRPYRKGRSHGEAVAELRRCEGTQFDPDVVEALVRAMGEGVQPKETVSQIEVVNAAV
ncbi:HD domain-containing phosphohydrolase [Acidobacteriota bacterium]